MNWIFIKEKSKTVVISNPKTIDETDYNRFIGMTLRDTERFIEYEQYLIDHKDIEERIEKLKDVEYV